MQEYLRTTEYTSAASSLLMIINHFHPEFELSKENEFRIWMSTANLPVKASSVYGLAVFAKKKGLNPRIVIGDKEYNFPDYRFKRYKKTDIEEAKFSSGVYYKEAKELDILIEEREFRLKKVEQLLSDGNIILLRLNVGVLRGTRSASNYVVIFGKKKNFQVMDPEQGRLLVDRETLKEAFETLQTKKKRDNRMIIFERNNNPLE